MPPALRLAFRCDRWGALPHAGGVLDQPAGLLDHMAALKDAYDTVKWYYNSGLSFSDIRKRYPSRFKKVNEYTRLIVHG